MKTMRCDEWVKKWENPRESVAVLAWKYLKILAF
jgi:hypothetical protein